MPDGSTTQILTSKPFTHAVVFYNSYYDGWTVKRWEESEINADETWSKHKHKKMEQLGITAEEYGRKYLDECLILTANKMEQL